MKEQVLQLDPHDDYVSARDKMGWVQTQRVLLVWPPRGRVLHRRLDLVLLHRHAHRLGAQLALVTADAEVREHAAELGLPVFPSVAATRAMRWRSRLPRLHPDRRAPRPDTAALRTAQFSRQKRALPAWAGLSLRASVFLLGLAGVLALASALGPSAVITLTPARQPLTVTVPLVADPDQPTVDAADGLIPARRVRVEVQDTQLLPTTGVVDVPNATAAGQVVFTNLTAAPAAAPAGVSVRTTSGAPVRFVTLEPAALEGRLNATATVAVRAVEPGPAGNVAAGQINAIDGPLGAQLAVTNPAPTGGGGFGQRAAVATADRENLRRSLEAQLRQSAREAITAQLGPGELLVAETVTVTQVLAESFDRAVGEPADALALTLRLAASGLVVSDADARQAAEAALRAQVPAGAALTDAPLRFARVAPPALDAAGVIRLSVAAEGTLVAELDREAVRRLVLGQPLDRAASLIQSFTLLSAPPEIALFPEVYARWMPYLPWLWLRVDVVVR